MCGLTSLTEREITYHGDASVNWANVKSSKCAYTLTLDYVQSKGNNDSPCDADSAIGNHA